MALEKKIFLGAEEDLDTVLEKIFQTKADKVILNVPRNSLLGLGLDSFQILKKECLAADKAVEIESIDEHILELADLAKLISFNPIFKTRTRAVSDILPRPRDLSILRAGEKKSSVFKTEELKKSATLSDEKEPPLLPARLSSGEEDTEVEEEPVLWKTRKVNLSVKIIGWLFLIIIVGGGFFLANNVLPRANIILTLKKIPANFDYKIEASKDVSKVIIGENNIILPGEVLTAKKNLEMTFKSTGRENVSKKANGTLIVYNNYSSDPQPLVATTRFEAPDNKIFRLEKQITVPGAKVIGGKVTPSEIEVIVIADKPGKEYNIEKPTRFTILGFKGTPRYEGFSAELKGKITGGFVGLRPVPTENDLANAKTKLRKVLENALESQTFILAKQFKTIEGGTTFNILEEKVREDITPEGDFGLFAEAEMKKIAFKEEDLKKAAVILVKKSLPGDLKIRQLKIDYKDAEIMEESKLSFTASGNIIFEPNVDSISLTAQLLGKTEKNMKELVSSLPGLEKANVSLWPFWVIHVPKDEKKIKLVIE